MTKDSTSHVIECSSCGEEYEIEFNVAAPERDVGFRGCAELDSDTACPQCGHDLTEQQIDKIADEVFERHADDEWAAYGDYLYEIMGDR